MVPLVRFEERIQNVDNHAIDDSHHDNCLAK